MPNKLASIRKLNTRKRGLAHVPGNNSITDHEPTVSHFVSMAVTTHSTRTILTTVGDNEDTLLVHSYDTHDIFLTASGSKREHRTAE